MKSSTHQVYRSIYVMKVIPRYQAFEEIKSSYSFFLKYRIANAIMVGQLPKIISPI
jgi:hypothetical protein